MPLIREKERTTNWNRTLSVLLHATIFKRGKINAHLKHNTFGRLLFRQNKTKSAVKLIAKQWRGDEGNIRMSFLRCDCNQLFICSPSNKKVERFEMRNWKYNSIFYDFGNGMRLRKLETDRAPVNIWLWFGDQSIVVRHCNN